MWTMSAKMTVVRSIHHEITTKEKLKLINEAALSPRMTGDHEEHDRENSTEDKKMWAFDIKASLAT